MFTIKNRLILGCAAISLCSATLLSHAEEKSWGKCKDQANAMQCRHDHMEKFQAQREKKLHDELAITKDQEPAWNTFVESMHKRPMDMERPQKSADSEKMSAPDRMEHHMTKMDDRQAAMKDRLSALKTFYAVLTPTQQAKMDKHAADMEKRFGRHHERGGADRPAPPKPN